MKKLLTAGLAALTLGGSVLGAAAPASARDWDHHGGRYYGHGNGAAVAAGIAGLAVGAALAGGGNYYAPPGYYYGPPPAYYAGPAYYSYYHSCRVAWRWDPYWGRYVRVRACY
jgi:hypothetical protein